MDSIAVPQGKSLVTWRSRHAHPSDRPGPATTTLAAAHGAVDDDLAAPDTPRLTARECTREALRLQRADSARALRLLKVRGMFREPELGLFRARHGVVGLGDDVREVHTGHNAEEG